MWTNSRKKWPVNCWISCEMSEPLGKNYRLLWLASAVANLGDGIGVVAWPWLASLLTRDPVAIALVAVFLRLPWFLFSLPAGVITDRLDRRKLVLGMDVFRFVALAVLALIVWQSLPITVQEGFPTAPLYWVLLFSALAIGFAEVLRDNAAQTLLPAIVVPQRLEAANGQLWSIEVLMNSLIGPPLAGFIITIAVPFAFLFNCLGFGFSAILIIAIRGDFKPAPRQRLPWQTEFKQGFSFLWRNTLLRNLALCLGIMNATYHMMMTGLILFTQDILGMGATQFGLLLTADALGGILGGILSEKITRNLGAGLALRVVLIVLFAQIAVIAVVSDAKPIWLMMAAASFASMVWNSITVSLRQRHIPAQLLGRVNSVYRFFGWGMMPLGLIASGLSVKFAENYFPHETALRAPFVLGAGLMGIVILLIWRHLSNDTLKQVKFS